MGQGKFVDIHGKRRKRIGIFFFYDADGVADNYIEYLLNGIVDCLDNLVIVSNGELTREAKALFGKFTQRGARNTGKLIIRENTGFDVWAYKAAIDYLGWEELDCCGELILFNHTIMGPIYPFEEVDVDPTPQWYSGFWFEFCPLGFDHGDYKVLIELKRDDGSIALVVNTGYHLVRSAGQTVIEYRPSEKTAELNDIMAGANSGIQEIRKDADGNLIVTGWGMIEGVDADDTSCILVVEDDNGYLGTFTTLPYAITYINNYYGSDLYYNSGFMASIPNFTGEELRLRVYVQHGDDTYGCNYRFESDGDIANIIMIQE